MNEIANIIIAVLLYCLVVFAAIWAFRGIIREIERQNRQREKTAMVEAARKEQRREELIAWWERASGGLKS